MALSLTNLLDSMKEELVSTLSPWLYGIICKLPPEYQPHFDRVLLSGIYLKLASIERASAFGTNYFRITPYTLSSTPQKILERDAQQLVRKVSIWIDAASGGPTPTIRISTLGTGTGGGGIRVNAGTVNELGEVPSTTELHGASTTSTVIYVIERA
mgnify:FL=1